MGNWNKDNAIAAQNAGSTAAQLYQVVAVPGQPFNATLYNEIRTEVFNGTLALAGAGAVVEVTEGSPPVGGYNSSGPSSSGGGRTDPGSVDVKFGKHRGKTFDQINLEDREWIEWAAENSNNEFIKRVAREFLEQ